MSGPHRGNDGLERSPGLTCSLWSPWEGYAGSCRRSVIPRVQGVAAARVALYAWLRPVVTAVAVMVAKDRVAADHLVVGARVARVRLGLSDAVVVAGAGSGRQRLALLAGPSLSLALDDLEEAARQVKVDGVVGAGPVVMEDPEIALALLAEVAEVLARDAGIEPARVCDRAIAGQVERAVAGHLRGEL